VAELAGINLTDFLEEGKGAGSGGQTQGGKAKAKVIAGHELFFWRVPFGPVSVVRILTIALSGLLLETETSCVFLRSLGFLVGCALHVA